MKVQTFYSYNLYLIVNLNVVDGKYHVVKIWPLTSKTF